MSHELSQFERDRRRSLIPEIMRLHWVSGWTIKHIAEHLGLPSASVRQMTVKHGGQFRSESEAHVAQENAYTPSTIHKRALAYARTCERKGRIHPTLEQPLYDACSALGMVLIPQKAFGTRNIDFVWEQRKLAIDICGFTKIHPPQKRPFKSVKAHLELAVAADYRYAVVVAIVRPRIIDFSAIAQALHDFSGNVASFDHLGNVVEGGPCVSGHSGRA